MYGCGLPIDPVELQGCKEYVEDVLNYYQEDGYDILSATVTVSFRLLESMSPDEGEAMLAVARGMCSTFDTVNSAEAMVIDYPLRQRHIEVAVAEEEARQEEALTSVTQWTGIADRKMFDGLGGKPPAWLLAWQTCPTHWADG